MIEKLREAIFEATEHIGSSFDSPDDNWLAHLFLVSDDDCKVIQISEMNSETKKVLPKFIKNEVKEYNACAGAFVVQIYASFFDANNPLAETTLSILKSLGVRNDPNHKELLMLEVADKERTETWIAEIERHENRIPTLKPWEKMEVENSIGKFGNIIYKALKDM